MRVHDTQAVHILGTRTTHKRSGIIAASALVALYFFLAFMTLFVWHAAGEYALTGDEPHYLVMTRGLIVHHTLEQFQAYQDAFSQSLFTVWGPPGTVPTPDNTHMLLGPNGYFNVHNVGLPFLMVVPYLIGGVTAVKVFMVLFSGLAVVTFWKISGVFTPRLWVRVLAVACVALAMPLLPAAGQIYPDIPSGTLALVGVYWLLTVSKKRAWWVNIVMALAVAYLPLLQIKFAPATIILTVGIAIGLYRNSTRRRRFVSILPIVVPVVVSLIGLALYNQYAFGNATGPYAKNSVEISPHAFMVFLGLGYDQNQGILFQNLAMFVGVVGIGLLFAKRLWFMVAWVLIFASIIVPNAVYPNWYGGGSFSGRFEWPAAMMFGIVTIYGLVRLAEASRVWVVIVGGLGLLAQAYYYVSYTFTTIQLYNRPVDTWLVNYSIFMFPLQNWFPALYDTDWASSFAPNYVWSVIVAVLLAAGFVMGFARISMSRAAWLGTSAAAVAAVVIAGVTADPPAVPREYGPAELSVAQGTRTDAGITVSAAHGQGGGVVTFGPFAQLRKATYTVHLTYRSSAPTTTSIGSWSVLIGNNVPVASADLPGTGNADSTVELTVQLADRIPTLLQAQPNWNGTDDLTVEAVTVALDQ